MTTLFKWSITLVVCALIATTGSAQTVAIISSQEVKPLHNMDETWSSIVLAAGESAQIHTSDFLSDTDIIAQVDHLILSSGIATITPAQQDNILQFVQDGGNVYVQSEHSPDFDGNQLFIHLLESTGSGFEWRSNKLGNVGPLNITNGFETDQTDNLLDYFWFGTEGCGDGQVTSFLQSGDSNYGFYYRSADTTLGNVITITDHDWIRTIQDNPVPREALMVSVFEILTQGFSGKSTYVHPTIAISEDINFCTDDTATAEVEHADAQDVVWFQNGQQIATGPILDINSIAHGDTLYAQVSAGSGCLTTTVTSDTLVIIKEGQLPIIDASLLQLAPICPGTSARITLEYDSTLMDISHFWFLNGQDTPIKTDFFQLDHPNDGDIVEHSMTYFDGCTDIELATTGSVTISIVDVAVPSITITGQSAACIDLITELSLATENIAAPQITWYIDGVAHNENQNNIEINTTGTNQEVYATIVYDNTCTGTNTITTTSVQVGAQPVEIHLEEKTDIDCEYTEGIIEVSSNNANATFSWSNGESESYISRLPTGIYDLTVTNTVGCTATASYEITEVVFPLAESFETIQPDCNNETGTVQLLLAENDLTNVSIQWIDATGSVISTAEHNEQLAPGSYEIHIDVNGNCKEVHNVHIEAYVHDVQIMIDTIVADPNELIQLKANVNINGEYQIVWQADPSLNCLDCPSNEINASHNTIYYYEIIPADGCPIQKAIQVLIKRSPPYYAPTAFSPNNDGINDYYKIGTRSDVYPTSSLLIFDRWGSLIHEEQGDTRGWDGKSFGKNIQKGIFVFVQNFEDTSGNQYQAKGSITVM